MEEIANVCWFVFRLALFFRDSCSSENMGVNWLQSSEVHEKLEYLISRPDGFFGDLAFCYSADS